MIVHRFLSYFLSLCLLTSSLSFARESASVSLEENALKNVRKMTLTIFQDLEKQGLRFESLKGTPLNAQQLIDQSVRNFIVNLPDDLENILPIKLQFKINEKKLSKNHLSLAIATIEKQGHKRLATRALSLDLENQTGASLVHHVKTIIKNLISETKTILRTTGRLPASGLLSKIIARLCGLALATIFIVFVDYIIPAVRISVELAHRYRVPLYIFIAFTSIWGTLSLIREIIKSADGGE